MNGKEIYGRTIYARREMYLHNMDSNGSVELLYASNVAYVHRTVKYSLLKSFK